MLEEVDKIIKRLCESVQNEIENGLDIRDCDSRLPEVIKALAELLTARAKYATKRPQLVVDGKKAGEIICQSALKAIHDKQKGNP